MENRKRDILLRKVNESKDKRIRLSYIIEDKYRRKLGLKRLGKETKELITRTVSALEEMHKDNWDIQFSYTGDSLNPRPTFIVRYPEFYIEDECGKREKVWDTFARFDIRESESYASTNIMNSFLNEIYSQEYVIIDKIANNLGIDTNEATLHYIKINSPYTLSGIDAGLYRNVWVANIELRSTTKTPEQLIAQFCNSHVTSDPFTNYKDKYSCMKGLSYCTGEEEEGLNMFTCATHYKEGDYSMELFLHTLEHAISYESEEGGPYKHIGSLSTSEEVVPNADNTDCMLMYNKLVQRIVGGEIEPELAYDLSEDRVDLVLTPEFEGLLRLYGEDYTAYPSNTVCRINTHGQERKIINTDYKKDFLDNFTGELEENEPLMYFQAEPIYPKIKLEGINYEEDDKSNFKITQYVQRQVLRDLQQKINSYIHEENNSRRFNRANHRQESF